MTVSVFARLDNEGAAAAAAAAAADADLLAQVDAARALHEESRGEYVSNAVRRFSALASDADFTTLKGTLERAEDPELSALKTMLVWAARRDLAAAEAAPGGTSAAAKR